jgi:hypothetical protein
MSTSVLPEVVVRGLRNCTLTVVGLLRGETQNILDRNIELAGGASIPEF